MHYLIAILLCPLGGLLANIIGRKLCLVVFAINFLVGWALIAVSWCIPVLFVGRFLTVVSAGGVTVSIGVYISETSHPSIRSSLAVFQSLFLSFGFLTVLGVGYFIEDWRNLAWVCSIPALILLPIIFFLPETPYHLVEKNKNKDARDSLQFFRGKHYDINEELEEIIDKHEEKVAVNSRSSKANWNTILKRFCSGAFGRPFMCIGVLRLLTQWGEMANLIIYMISIFKQPKCSINPELAPVFVGMIQVVAAVLTGFIVRKTSPKVLYISNTINISSE